MTQLSHPYLTQAYLHQQGRLLKLRADHHHAVHDDQPAAGRRTNPARRGRPLLARFAVAAHRLRMGWTTDRQSQTSRRYKAST